MSPDTTNDYERDTRRAYQDETRAAAYKRRQTRALSWARFSTWREQTVILGFARGLGLGPRSLVLDAPCGTGILGRVLCELGCRVVAGDIAVEMMRLARAEYPPDGFRGFLQADLLRLPLAPASVDGAMLLGFLHRVPREARRGALAEFAAVSRGPIIATCSIDNALQRVKVGILRIVGHDYAPAPHRARFEAIVADCEAAGLAVMSWQRPVPFFSSEAVLVLQRRKDSPG